MAILYDPAATTPPSPEDEALALRRHYLTDPTYVPDPHEQEATVLRDALRFLTHPSEKDHS
jgi:hypothetical protein